MKNPTHDVSLPLGGVFSDVNREGESLCSWMYCCLHTVCDRSHADWSLQRGWFVSLANCWYAQFLSASLHCWSNLVKEEFFFFKETTMLLIHQWYSNLCKHSNVINKNKYQLLCLMVNFRSDQDLMVNFCSDQNCEMAVTESNGLCKPVRVPEEHFWKKLHVLCSLRWSKAFLTFQIVCSILIR